MKTVLAGLCGAAAILASGNAAASITWTLTNGAYASPVVGTFNSGTADNGADTTTADKTLSSTVGWANTGGSNSTVASSAQTLQEGGLTNQSGSGVGMTNLDACSTASGNCDLNDGTAPEHAIDNNGRYEAALLSFSKAVKLSTVTVGWNGGDWDMTVMAYIGTGAPVLLGKTWGGVASDPLWKKISVNAPGTNLSGTANDSVDKFVDVSALGQYSQYWLIGAYNPLADTSAVSGITSQDDYFKLAAVTGCVDGSATSCTSTGGTTGGSTGGGSTGGNRVPEPGSLALFGLALAGLMARRKGVRA